MTLAHFDLVQCQFILNEAIRLDRYDIFHFGTPSTLALADSPIGWQGYLFLAPGTGAIGRFVNGRANIHVGGGGEALVYKGLGVGGEIGAVTPWSSPGGGFICCLSQTTIGLTSTNFSYHVLPGSADRRLEPFVTGGYSLFFGRPHSSGYNVGAGLNVWVNKSVAMRVEVREQKSYWHEVFGIRIGVTFR